MKRRGEISGLSRQHPFKLDVNGVHIATYYADFVYTDKNGKQHVEDPKGVRTPIFLMKARLMKAIFGIKVEVL